jgi:hypothetical protein
VGEAMAFLLALKRSGRVTDQDAAERCLKEWWERQAR